MRNLGIINRLISYFKWKFGKYQYRIKIVNDNPKPENINNNIIYVVGGKDYVKWAYLKCPDNCGETIMLNLSKSKSPSWSISQDKYGRTNISPSINKKDGCKSHFWIKKGNVNWVH